MQLIVHRKIQNVASFPKPWDEGTAHNKAAMDFTFTRSMANRQIMQKLGRSNFLSHEKYLPIGNTVGIKYR